MPIKVPDNLPALSQLKSEGVDIIPDKLAAKQDIRPLRLLLLNLMPKKRILKFNLRAYLATHLCRLN